MLKNDRTRNEVGAEGTNMDLHSVDGASTDGQDGMSICN